MVSAERGNGSHGNPNRMSRQDEESLRRVDAGANFVLESKGNWMHVAFHLATAIAAFPILSLPVSFATLGWVWGTIALVMATVVTFYAYNLISLVLEHFANQGRRHLRFRELAEDVAGPLFATYFVGPLQTIVCVGVIIGTTVLGGATIKIMYITFNPNATLKLYECISIFGVMVAILAELPSFHSLRYMSLLSLLMTLGFSSIAVIAAIYVGHSKNAPPRDYKLLGGSTHKVFGAFNGLAIIATAFGNSVIPETQATLAPPATGKMFKGLLGAYIVVCTTFFSISFSGYWAFGNQASANFFENLTPRNGHKIVPDWMVIVPNMLGIIQLLVVTVVYAQPLFDIFESKTGTISKGRFSARNLIPRVLVRTLFLALTTLVSTMFPFFGDIVAILGALGFTPLDFIFPILFYLIVFKPPKISIKFWGNVILCTIYTFVGFVGGISSIREFILSVNTYKLFANL